MKFHHATLTAAVLLLSAGAPRASADPAGIGLRGEYHSTIDLTGPVEFARTDGAINFEWAGSPAHGVASENFSVRWTGQVLAPVTGAYTFTTISDDGVRLWVNGAKVVDNWTRHSATTNHSAPITLTAGQRYDLKMEFFSGTGGATAKLMWTPPGKPSEVIPQSQLFPPPATFLSDLQWTSAVNGSGPVMRDLSNGGKPLTINGVKFAKGLGIRSPSDVRFALGGQYDVFTASVGIDDESAGSAGSSLFQVWLDGVKSYESQLLRGTNSARFVRVPVTGKNELRLVVTDGGDGSANDRGDWADAQLAKGGITLDPFLSDLDWSSASNGWGPVERDKSNGETAAGDGVPMSINGMKFAKGLGVHANSDVRFKLNAAFGSFVTWIGIDDEVGNNHGSAIFQIWLDGVKAFQSPELFGKSDAQKVALSVAGKNELRLLVTTGGDGNGYDHADWAGAQLFHGSVTPGPLSPPSTAPANLKAAPGNAQIVLTWSAVPGATSYNVYRGTASGAEGATPFAKGIASTTFTDAGLTNGTKLFYKVAAVNAGGVGPISDEAGAVPVPPTSPAPSGLTAAAGDAQVVLTWSPAAGATSYNVYRGTSAGGEAGMPVATGIAATTFTNTGLTNGKKYFFKVAGMNGGGAGPMSNEASAQPMPALPGAPTNLKAAPGEARIVLTWTAVPGAETYNVYRGTAAGAEATTPIATAITSATFTNTGLTDGKPMFYKVAAVNLSGTGAMSAEATATPVPPLPPAPTNVKAAPGDTKIVLTWSAANGATSYNVFRGTAAGLESATPLATGITAATFTDTGLTNGVKLFYKVAGVNLGGTGAQSGEVSATPVPPLPATPTGLTATGGDTVVMLTWNPSAGADSYNIYRGSSPGTESATPLATGVAITAFTDKGLPNGPAVYYKVAAVNLGGTSPRSAEASAQPISPPAAPPAGLISASRLLRQSSWGPTQATIDRVNLIGASAFLDEQFAAVASDYPASLKTDGSLEPLQERFFQNALTGPDQLRQRVAFALSQIFVVSGVKVSDPNAMVPYQKMMLDGAFGNFNDLLRNVTLSPAMGEFLDMVGNVKADPTKGVSPNENYAREVLQLFTIGLVMLNPDGSPTTNPTTATYDQTTIANLARVFTGWTYGDNKSTPPKGQNPPFYDGPMKPVDKFHDTGAKTVLGMPIAAGLNTTQDLDAALAIIFQHPNVGPFICKNLIQHLVTSNPSAGYVQRVAAVFANNGAGVRGDLKAVVKAILLDPEAALGQPASGHLREPALYIMSMLRALNAQVVDHPFISDKSEEMSQRIFYAPSVFNYFSPGFRTSSGLLGPEFQIYTTATALIRANFVTTLISGGFGSDVTIDLAPYIADAANPGALLDRVNFSLMGGLMSLPVRNSILAAVNAAPTNKEKAQTAIYLAVTSSQYQVEN